MNKGLTLDLNIPNGKIPNNGGKSESSHHMRSARSTPNLKGSTPIQNLTHPPRKERIHRKDTLRSSNSVSALSLKISTRNPDLPVTSLPGPPVPPRSFSQIHLSNMQKTCKYYYTQILFFFLHTSNLIQSF